MRGEFVCPRRSEIGGWAGRDVWRRGRPYRTCSYCGSVDPEQFLAAIRDGVPVGPTDKSYKAYVGDGPSKFYYQHFNDAQRDEFIGLFNEHVMKIGYPGFFYQAPFFMGFRPQ